MTLTNYSLDNFVAPHLSEITVNSAPEVMTDQQNYWVRNFILNTLIGVRLLNPARQYIMNFLRKTESSFHEYSNARLLLSEYIASDRDAISKYLSAVLHYEVCLAQTYQACMLAKNIIGLTKVFETGDGSTLDRLNKMYNLSKHMDTTIAAGQLPEDSIIPVWLTNDGLQSHVAALSFAELAKLLEDLGKIANKLSNPQELIKDQ